MLYDWFLDVLGGCEGGEGEGEGVGEMHVCDLFFCDNLLLDRIVRCREGIGRGEEWIDGWTDG